MLVLGLRTVVWFGLVWFLLWPNGCDSPGADEKLRASSKQERDRASVPRRRNKPETLARAGSRAYFEHAGLSRWTVVGVRFVWAVEFGLTSVEIKLLAAD